MEGATSPAFAVIVRDLPRVASPSIPAARAVDVVAATEAEVVPLPSS